MGEGDVCAHFKRSPMEVSMDAKQLTWMKALFLQRFILYKQKYEGEAVSFSKMWDYNCHQVENMACM